MEVWDLHHLDGEDWLGWLKSDLPLFAIVLGRLVFQLDPIGWGGWVRQP